MCLAHPYSPLIAQVSPLGRPTKLTPQVRETITTHLRAGATRTDAVAAARIDYTTFLDWMAAGSHPDATNGVSQLFQDVTCAEAEVAAEMAAVIKVAAIAGDWRAAESWLKRRRRADWGDNVAIDVDAEVARTLSQLAALGETAIPAQAPGGVSSPASPDQG